MHIVTPILVSFHRHGGVSTNDSWGRWGDINSVNSNGTRNGLKNDTIIIIWHLRGHIGTSSI